VDSGEYLLLHEWLIIAHNYLSGEEGRCKPKNKKRLEKRGKAKPEIFF
jgi:hypothetical protein